ncbi:MAG TPA: hypothetical protein VD735_07605 [Candidatus Saccharimonadales bacterium]|nr:hypothetical protein [Candidatus Saccharimonadales bacterium]
MKLFRRKQELQEALAQNDKQERTKLRAEVSELRGHVAHLMQLKPGPQAEDMRERVVNPKIVADTESGGQIAISIKRNPQLRNHGYISVEYWNARGVQAAQEAATKLDRGDDMTEAIAVDGLFDWRGNRLMEPSEDSPHYMKFDVNSGVWSYYNEIRVTETIGAASDTHKTYDYAQVQSLIKQNFTVLAEAAHVSPEYTGATAEQILATQDPWSAAYTPAMAAFDTPHITLP